MNFITDAEAKTLENKLQSLLDHNKKNVNAMMRNDIKTLKRLESKLGFCFPDASFKQFAYDIAVALTRTKIKGNGNRSTAMTNAFDNLWTIGMFGSVFIDIKVKGNAFRVHMMPNNDMATRFDNVIYIEPA